MAEKQKPKGPWINRFAIHLFTIVLAVLLLWLFDFLVQDIIDGRRSSGSLALGGGGWGRTK